MTAKQLSDANQPPSRDTVKLLYPNTHTLTLLHTEEIDFFTQCFVLFGRGLHISKHFVNQDIRPT